MLSKFNCKKVFAVLVASLMVIGVLPISSAMSNVQAASSVTTANVGGYEVYVPEGADLDGANSSTEVKSISTFTSGSSYANNKGWFVVDEDITIGDGSKWNNCAGNVNIILLDGKTLNFRGPLRNYNGSITIWSQSKQTGKMIINSSNGSATALGASESVNINGGSIETTNTDSYGISSPKFVLNDGNIKIKAEQFGMLAEGGGSSSSCVINKGTLDIESGSQCIDYYKVLINGGTVNLSSTGISGCGISSSILEVNDGVIKANAKGNGISSFTVKINGGDIIAQATGSEDYDGFAFIGNFIEINGGNLTAKGTHNGILCCDFEDDNGAFQPGSLVINGGNVVAESLIQSNWSYFEDDYDYSYASGIFGLDSSMTINGGSLTATCNGNPYKAYGIYMSNGLTVKNNPSTVMVGTSAPGSAFTGSDYSTINKNVNYKYVKIDYTAKTSGNSTFVAPKTSDSNVLVLILAMIFTGISLISMTSKASKRR